MRVFVDTPADGRQHAVIVTGFTNRELNDWRRRPTTDTAWTNAFRVFVSGNEAASVDGRYAASDTAMEFFPRFPFDAGLEYAIVIEPSRISANHTGPNVNMKFLMAARELSASTRVTRILPSTDRLPENQLRLYIEFSAPMSREAGLDYVHLIDENGREVPAAFLPLDGDFWNADRTRYTLFLDPGRVKRGILPNEQMGRALRNGRRYSLNVDSTWRDGRGMPLVSSYRHPIRVGPADFNPIALAQWRFTSPRSGTLDTLAVRFPEPLDHGLLRRAIGVETGSAANVTGEVALARGEREWKFIPSHPWAAGSYSLVVLSILEDLAGNRINRAFEVDLFERVDSTSAAARFTLPFTVR